MLKIKPFFYFKFSLLKTLFTGKIIHFKDQVGSTNDWASLKMKTEKVLEGTIFRADVQVNGKGQRGRVWASSAGKNILTSYVLYPTFLRSDQQFSLIKAISLGVKDLLDKYLIDKAKIKWPNDIYVNDLKIAGVLIESSMKGSIVASSVVGIGLNVNENKFDSAINATSLILELGKGFDLDRLLFELSFYIEKRYLSIRYNQKSVDEEYLQALYQLNKPVKYEIGGAINVMVNRGVDEIGQLLLEDQYGRINPYGLHQAKMILT